MERAWIDLRKQLELDGLERCIKHRHPKTCNPKRFASMCANCLVLLSVAQLRESGRFTAKQIDAIAKLIKDVIHATEIRVSNEFDAPRLNLE